MSDYVPTTWVEGGAPGISAANLQKIETGIDTAHQELDDHIALTSGAHAATAISYAGGTGIAATTVENAIDTLASGKLDSAAHTLAAHDTLGLATQTELDAHINMATGAHAATAISYAGGPGISATNVETALDELATEKMDVHTHPYIANTLADAKGDLIAGSANDTWVRVAVGANGKGLIADSAQPGGVGWAGQMVLIAETLIGTNAADVRWLNIPQDYRHLMIIYSARTTHSGPCGTSIRFNNDAGASYHWAAMVNNGSNGGNVTNEIGGSTFGGRVGVLPGTNVGSSTPGSVRCFIMDYTRTNLQKSFEAGGNVHDAPGPQIRVHAGLYFGSNLAITEIHLITDTAGFAANATFSLYGLGRA